jgi:hypothetical protein
MRRTVVGVIAVVAATSVFTLMSGLGSAEAASMLPSTQSGSAAGFSPSAEAVTLRALHDSLESQFRAKDAAAMRTTQSALATELAKVRAAAAGTKGKSAMAPDTVTATGKAVALNDQLGRALAALADQHGQSAADLPLPGVGSLTALVQSLLTLVLSIVTGLLGGLPVPVPVPPVPVPVGSASGPVAG